MRSAGLWAGDPATMTREQGGRIVQAITIGQRADYMLADLDRKQTSPQGKSKPTGSPVWRLPVPLQLLVA